MKTILCYGDSNTWGHEPGTENRFSREKRWPGVLRKELGDGYEIIEEGLGGRTTVWDDPIEAYRNGKEYLIPCLETHRPLDLVVLMLGTNDLKRRFSLSAADIASGAGVLLDIVQRSDVGPGGRPPAVLLMAPPPFGKLSDYTQFAKEATSESKRFSEQFGRVAREYGCKFFDTAQVISSSDIDGIHLEASQHQKLGEAVALLAKQILK